MPSEKLSTKVIAKCRPLTETEVKSGTKNIVKTSHKVIKLDSGGKEQSFQLDNAYDSNTKSRQIYAEEVESYIQRALLGNNVTILALGTTGSGKTYAMTGIEDDPGIITCVNSGLYRLISEVADKKQVFVTLTFVEILDEEIIDVLNPHDKEMKIREHPQLGIYVDGLSEFVVRSAEDLQRYYEQGTRARKMGTFNVNKHRARANAIFSIHIEQKETQSSKVGVRSTITLADLAGIEEGRESNPLADALAGGKSGGPKASQASKTTQLLQESFGGNSATLILATISPADSCFKDTQLTLTLAQSSRSTKNEVKVNIDETTSILSDLREEISSIRNKIAKATKPNKDDVVRMQELVKDLQVAKRQTWEEKENLSAMFEEERKTNLANKGILEWVMDTMRRGDKEVQERRILLQKEKDQLTLQYKDNRLKVDEIKEELQKKILTYSKMAESGKANEADTKKQVSAIHEMKEKLKKETDILKEIKRKLKEVQDKMKTEEESADGQFLVKGNAELRQMVEAEERRRLENDNKTMIADELDQIKINTEHEKAEIQMAVSQGKTYKTEEAMQNEITLVDLRAERSLVTLKLQALQKEKGQLSKDLENAFKRHKEEMEIQKLQHFQTFREYREMFEYQKAVIEQRYRGLLEDSVQDAIFLSSRNNELMDENEALQQELAEMKDKVTRLEGDLTR